MAYYIIQRNLSYIMTFCKGHYVALIFILITLYLYVMFYLCRLNTLIYGYVAFSLKVLLCHILAKFLNEFVMLWCSTRVIWNCNVLQGFCHILMYIKCYDTFWHSSRLMSLCDIDQGLYGIAMFCKGFVTLWCISSVMMHFGIHQGLCRFATLIKGYMYMPTQPKMWDINNVTFGVH